MQTRNENLKWPLQQKVYVQNYKSRRKTRSWNPQGALKGSEGWLSLPGQERAEHTQQKEEQE